MYTTNRRAGFAKLRGAPGVATTTAVANSRAARPGRESWQPLESLNAAAAGLLTRFGELEFQAAGTVAEVATGAPAAAISCNSALWSSMKARKARAGAGWKRPSEIMAMVRRRE